MRNAIRCCISCILPCGALDVIRIVHANGRVEEISGSVKAAEIMKLHPKHVLKKPTSSPPSTGDGIPRIVVVPPDAELKRGRIYFLIPAAAKPPPRSSTAKIRNKRKDQHQEEINNTTTVKTGCSISAAANLLISDRYLTEILSEKTKGNRRRGRVGVWRPHLESISETPVEAA